MNKNLYIGVLIFQSETKALSNFYILLPEKLKIK